MQNAWIAFEFWNDMYKNSSHIAVDVMLYLTIAWIECATGKESMCACGCVRITNHIDWTKWKMNISILWYVFPSFLHLVIVLFVY